MTASASFTALLGGDAPVDRAGPDSSVRSRFTRPAVTLPIVVLLLAATLAIVFLDRGPKGPGPGEAIVQIDGTARLVRTGGAASTVSGSLRLEPGDRLALRTGVATFELADGVRYEARGRSGRAPGTSVKMGTTPELDAGPLLVTTSASSAVVQSGSARATAGPDAAIRLDRSLAVRLGAYRGAAELQSAGAQRRVPPLRAADAVGPGELTRPNPLRYAASDSWDRRFLPDAIYLDGQLDPLARGVATSGLPPADLLDAIRTRIDDRPSAARLADLAAARPVDVDLAMGVAVVGSGDPGRPFAQRFGKGFAFHDDGAPWGLVAMDLDADPVAVLDVLRGALDGRSLAGALDLAGISPTDGSQTSGGFDSAASTAPVDATVPGVDAETGAPGGAATTPGVAAPVDAVPPTGSGPAATSPATPGVTVPGVPGAPGVTLPGVTLPGVTLPGVTLPGVSLPPVKLPPVQLPPVKLPGGVTVTTPPVTTPPILGPVLGGVNGTIGGVTGTVNGTVGGVTGGLGGLLGP